MRLLAAALAVLMLQATAPMRTIARGDQSGVETARQAVARTAAEWTALWKQHAPGRPRPAVDFARSTVLGIFLGSRPTVGFTVAIETIERQGTELVVTYRERRPNPTDMVAQMLTAPYVLVGCYLPALWIVMRRPNEGSVPQCVERFVERWPAWLRGVPASAITSSSSCVTPEHTSGAGFIRSATDAGQRESTT